MEKGQTYIREIPSKIGEKVKICGWLYNMRSSGKLRFLQIRDGTGFIQGIITQDEVADDVFKSTDNLTQESSIKVWGVPGQDARAPTGYELKIEDLEIVQIAEKYPITLKNHGVGFLMDNRHLWIRSSKQIPTLKIRDEVIKALRDFFHQEGFYETSAPILTPVSVEGTTTLFEVDYFGDNAYLTQSGQLYLEATCMSLGNVFWIGPTFRAEKSKTRKHLTEFWMAEAEMAYCDHECNLKIQEELIKYICRQVITNRRSELKELNRDIQKLEKEIDQPFARITYQKALNLLKQNEFEINWGDDFGAKEEEFIGDYFNRPVFVEAFPKTMKPFYMEPMPGDPNLVLAADLLAPEGYGELIGGSQRIAELNLLEERLEEDNLPKKPYQWYLDLRKYGSVPHSGFGLGVERLIAWLAGLSHLRESIPFPRQIHRLSP